MRILFFGTPDFAVPSLEELLRRHQVVGVVTQPDRRAGRGQAVTRPPVKVMAERAGVPVLQPEKLRVGDWPQILRDMKADVGAVVAFGQILPKAVLEAPGLGCINLHASLLPRFRGAAPIAWAIVRGERETGLTTFLMDAGMDTGQILLQEPLSIGPGETTGELAGRMARLGAPLLRRTLEMWADGQIIPRPQNHEAATYAPRLKKEDGVIRWEAPARDVVNLVRGMNPWPGGQTRWTGGQLLIWRAAAFAEDADALPGTLVPLPGEEGLGVAAGEGIVRILECQRENRRHVSWEDFIRGARISAGMRLG